jgi:hypothetical protein
VNLVGKAISQLGAIGAQDVDTVIRPTKTFFKSKHSRHTAFAMEPKDFQFQNVVDYNRSVQAVIPRNGDLLAKLYLVIELNPLTANQNGATGMFVDDIGRAMLNEVDFEAGSVFYDRLRPEFLHIWEELTILTENQLGQLTGKSAVPLTRTLWAQSSQWLYVPLEFWFQREYGAALPLVALHLTDVKIDVTLNPKNTLIIDAANTPVPGYSPGTTDGSINQFFLTGEFIYLDDPERDFFARTEHKYLITQNQYQQTTIQANSGLTANIDMHFNHPTKELIFFGRQITFETAPFYDPFNFSGQEGTVVAPPPPANPAFNAPVPGQGEFLQELFRTMQITLNGNNRVNARDPKYYSVIQPYNHHTRVPQKQGIYVYSFALSPEAPGPTGSLNFSRIENSQLQFVFRTQPYVNIDFQIIARNLNVVSVGGGKRSNAAVKASVSRHTQCKAFASDFTKWNCNTSKFRETP